MGVPLTVQDVPGVVPVVEGYRIPKDRTTCATRA